MAWRNHKILAVIPARGGSKSIPRKNLCRVGGLSLIAHTARTVKALPWIDRAVLSTDDEEMAEEGRVHGLAVPFLRPGELAQDNSTAVETWQHAWQGAETHYQEQFQLSILLQPTTPFRNPADVERTLTVMTEHGYRAATTVSPVPGHFTPEKILTIDRQGCVHYFHPDGGKHSNRQSIPPYYYRNGVCYAVTRDLLLEEGKIIDDQCGAVLIDDPVVNIDDPFDLELAEFLYARTANRPTHST